MECNAELRNPGIVTKGSTRMDWLLPTWESESDQRPTPYERSAG